MVAARKTFFVLLVMLLAPMASAIDSSQSPEEEFWIEHLQIGIQWKLQIQSNRL